MHTLPSSSRPKWFDTKGQPVSCIEKLKILDENLAEIKAICEEAIEDAELMGCDADYVRGELQKIVNNV